MCKHIRILLPNVPGEAAGVIKQLGKTSNYQFNVLGYMLSDLGEAGILHLLVTHHDRAFVLLKDRYKNRAAEKEVLIVSIPHVPGQLLSLLEVLSKQKINVRTSYQGFSENGTALIVIEPNSETDLARAKAALEKASASIVVEQP
jgi:hypothetical protein